MATTLRQPLVRRCIRCARTGTKAFRAVDAADSGAWICSHRKTCLSRQQQRWRSGGRIGPGRRGSPSLGAWFDEGRPIWVIGPPDAERQRLAHTLRENTCPDVTELDASPPALARLAHNAACMIVVDSSMAESVAMRNELVRRLSQRTLRNLPILVCCTSREELRPPWSDILDQPNVGVLERPFDAEQLVAEAERLLSVTEASAG